MEVARPIFCETSMPQSGFVESFCPDAIAVTAFVIVAATIPLNRLSSSLFLIMWTGIQLPQRLTFTVTGRQKYRTISLTARGQDSAKILLQRRPGAPCG